MKPPANATENNRRQSSSSSRNLWPVVLVAYFIVFITFIVVFIVFASRQKVDLVSHDYYEEEVRYQGQIDRVKRTQALSLPADVTYDAAQQSLTVALPAEHARQAPSGRIYFYRPSDAGLDLDVDLAVNADGVQQWDAKNLKAGLWKVRVEWTVAGKDFLVDKMIVINPG